MCNTRVNSNVNYGLWVIRCVNTSTMMIKNVPLWMLIMGDGVGQGIVGTLFSAQLCCEPKTAQKIHSTKKTLQ